MSKDKKATIDVRGSSITVLSKQEEDYISLTDMVRNFEGGSALIEQWLKNKDTVLFLGVWERLHNPDFNSPEFEGIKNEAGRNSFFLSAKKWIEKTNAKGLFASAGRYGSTFAHKDIAFEFGSWLSPEFKLYLLKEFQRLKDDEYRGLSLSWNLNRTLSKLNYRIHTDAIKEHIIPAVVSKAQAAIVYATEADMLNVALFGQTAKEWRDANPELEGNMREYAMIEQLLVLANIEGMNAEFIHMGLLQSELIKRLNEIAIRQMKVLTKNITVKKLHQQTDRGGGE
ncbi:MAG: KilA-N domain-containing protein [Nitrospirae bacterium]|nr:KilA-N domain-containing protein [Nitrospirota bacterium]